MREIDAIKQFCGSCQGLRPDIFPAVNSFVVVKNAKIFFQPRQRVKAVGGDSHRTVAARRQSALKEFASREVEICESIEDALTAGKSIPGFLALTKTPSGGVKAIPNKVKAIVAASALGLARMIDREMVNPVDVWALLGLVEKPAPKPGPKKSGWARVGGFADLGNYSR